MTNIAEEFIWSKGLKEEYNAYVKSSEENTEPEQHITRTQTLRWHDARKDIPEMNRVCLIKVPDRPWNFDVLVDSLLADLAVNDAAIHGLVEESLGHLGSNELCSMFNHGIFLC